jgi:hypothetical protein
LISRNLLETLSPKHLEALNWFAENAGKEVPYSVLDERRLVTKAKGIYKPAGTEYALSVRDVIKSSYQTGIYPDEDAGSWRVVYAQEGVGEANRDALYTNKGLLACVRDAIPVGVLIQTRPKPNTTYRVLGLAYVLEWNNDNFLLEGPASPIGRFDWENDLSEVAARLSVEGYFEIDSLTGVREKTLRAIAIRQGQSVFRANLLDAYEATCAVSGYKVTQVLEAAHIVPYQGPKTNLVINGLLLRADLHTLFDLGLLAINESDFRVQMAPILLESPYRELSNGHLKLPTDPANWPSPEALRHHRLTSSVG